MLVTAITGSLGSCQSGDRSGLGADAADLARVESEYPIGEVDRLTPRLYLILLGGVEEAAQKENIVRASIAECLRESGWAAGDGPVTSSEMPADARVIYRPLSVDEATRDGYDSILGSGGAPGPSSIEMFRSALPTSELSAFDAIQSTCQRRAMSDVFGDIDAREGARVEIEAKYNEFLDRLAGQSEVRTLNREWADCVAKQGIDLQAEDPPSLIDSAVKLSPSQRSAVALADARCRVEVGYEDRYVSTFRRYEATFIAENEAAILAVVNLASDG